MQIKYSACFCSLDEHERMETCGACWQMSRFITLVQGSFRKYEKKETKFSCDGFLYQASDVLGFDFWQWRGQSTRGLLKYLKQRLVSASYTPLQPGESARQLHSNTSHTFTHTHPALICNKMQHSTPESEQRWGTGWWRWQEREITRPGRWKKSRQTD